MAGTKSPLIDIIAGARPNFMKIAPIIRSMRSEEHTSELQSH